MNVPYPTTFVGVDVGKHELVLARVAEPGTEAFPNTPTGIVGLIAALGPPGRIHVAFEATGGYEWALWEALDAANVTARQVAPAEVRAFARSRGALAKTDAIDAAQIAAFAAFRPNAGRNLSAKSVRDLRALVAARRTRVTDKKRVQTRMKRISCPLMQAMEQEMTALLTAQIRVLDAKIKAQIADNPDLAHSAALLRSIPGVGPVFTATLLAELPELGTLSAKAVAALSGLAPMARDSGTFRGKRFISGGRKPVRDIAFMAATVALKHNPDMKRFFDRLRDRGLPHKKAAIATARKLIVITNTVLKRGTPWLAEPQV